MTLVSSGVSPYLLGVSIFFTGQFIENTSTVVNGAVSPTLHRGSTGESVKTLQQLLKDKSYKIIVDGIFGPITERIVKLFQKQNKLIVDGWVGIKTWSALIQSK